MNSEIHIVRFSPIYANDFARLNYEWIEKYFEIEKHDREILDHPFEVIVKPGGEVFFALTPTDEVIGTVAMINADEMFELTKMAVAPNFQGLGISNLLMEACIEFARSKSVMTIFLETNSKLPTAIRLYHKFGFVNTPLDPDSEYSRANVRMELNLLLGKNSSTQPQHLPST